MWWIFIFDMLVFASILSCDLLNLEHEIECLENSGVDGIHIDVMDGHFVPNIAFGLDFIKQICRKTKLPASVHLMIENPDDFIDVISFSNINYIIVHVEGNRNLTKTISRIKDNGIGVGIAINPQTDIKEVKRYLNLIDMVLVMGVYPGFGGQALIHSTIDKIKHLKKLKEAEHIVVGIDGGINDKTASIANDAKTDILIVGSYLFDDSKKSSTADIKEKLKILCREISEV